MLLAAPQNEVVMQVANDLLERVEDAGDFTKDWDTGIREWLQFRKGNPTEAAALGSKPSGSPTPTTPMLARPRRSEYVKTLIGFRSAIALASVGRSEEARQAYAESFKNLGPAPSAEKPRDLGESYARWYLAEAHRREAEQLFKGKGIAIPDAVSSSKF